MCQTFLLRERESGGELGQIQKLTPFLVHKNLQNGPQIHYLSCLKSAISDKGLHVMPPKGNLL